MTDERKTIKCPECNGELAHPNHAPALCPLCGGDGEIVVSRKPRNEPRRHGINWMDHRCPDYVPAVQEGI